MKALFLLLAFLCAPAFAQRPEPPLYPPPPNHEGRPNQNPGTPGGYYPPRWCQGYSWHDYRRDMRRCGFEQQCRRYYRSKANRCGIGL